MTENEPPTVDNDQVTKLLRAWSSGEAAALDRLTPLVYNELRKIARFHMAHEAPGHTLQATALIHEAFVKLAGLTEAEWPSRRHFFAATSQIMRRILVDYARKKRSFKRGKEMKRVPLQEAITESADSAGVSVVLAFDEVLTRLEAIDSRKARILESWFFSGMTIEEIAKTMDLGTSTVQRDLDFAKVWLARELGSRDP